MDQHFCNIMIHLENSTTNSVRILFERIETELFHRFSPSKINHVKNIIIDQDIDAILLSSMSEENIVDVFNGISWEIRRSLKEEG